MVETIKSSAQTLSTHAGLIPLEGGLVCTDNYTELMLVGEAFMRGHLVLLPRNWKTSHIHEQRGPVTAGYSLGMEEDRN